MVPDNPLESIQEKRVCKIHPLPVVVGGARRGSAEKCPPKACKKGRSGLGMMCGSWTQSVGNHVPCGWGHRIVPLPLLHMYMLRDWSPGKLTVPQVVGWAQHAGADSEGWGSGPHSTIGPLLGGGTEAPKEWTEGSSIVEMPGEFHHDSLQWLHSLSLHPKKKQGSKY